MLRSNFCDCSNVYIVAKRTITVEGAQNRDKHSRNLVLKNNAVFIPCISKINNALIDNVEDLDTVMPMYNLLEDSNNYTKTSGSLWNYYKDILTDPITNSESFKCKTSITGKTANDGNTKDVEFFVPLKHLGRFRKSLNIPLINCEVNLILTCPKNCVLTDTAARDANPNVGPPVVAIHAPTNANFKTKDAKLYVTVATLSAENENTFRTIKSRI